METLQKQTESSVDTLSMNDEAPQMHVTLQDGSWMECMGDENSNVFFYGYSQGMSVVEKVIGWDAREIVEMLTKAVNNRTRERNFFRLYSEYLEENITEEEFNRELTEHEDDYVVEGEEKPTADRLRKALFLSSVIKDTDNSEQLSSLFSFDSIATDEGLKKLDSHGDIQ